MPAELLILAAMSTRHRTKDVQWESLFTLQDKPAMPLQQRLRLDYER